MTARTLDELRQIAAEMRARGQRPSSPAGEPCPGSPISLEPFRAGSVHQRHPDPMRHARGPAADPADVSPDDA